MKFSRLYNESLCFLVVCVNVIDLSFLEISVSTVWLEKHNKFCSQKIIRGSSTHKVIKTMNIYILEIFLTSIKSSVFPC